MIPCIKVLFLYQKRGIRKDAPFLVASLRLAMIRFAQILGREYPIPSQARPMQN